MLSNGNMMVMCGQYRFSGLYQFIRADHRRALPSISRSNIGNRATAIGRPADGTVIPGTGGMTATMMTLRGNGVISRAHFVSVDKQSPDSHCVRGNCDLWSTSLYLVMPKMRYKRQRHLSDGTKMPPQSCNPRCAKGTSKYDFGKGTASKDPLILVG